MQNSKGINRGKASRPLLKFLVLMVIPVIISALLGLASPALSATIAGGYTQSVGLRADGSVVGWGAQPIGPNPVPDEAKSGVVAVAGFANNFLAVKNNGTVVAWTDYTRDINVPDEAKSGVVAVSSGGGHSLALKADGTVVAWGDNGNGQCDVPEGLSGVVAVAAGGIFGGLALKADGTVVAWGDNSFGECDVPEGLSGVVAVGAGDSHSLALKADGTVVAWGKNLAGQLNVPSGLSGVVAVAAGYYYSLALKADGTVVAWGFNGSGQCDVPEGLSGVVAVSAGFYHSLALKADGTVVAWGDNQDGQCNWPGIPLALAPVAEIDPHEAVAPGTLVTLNGANSFDYDHNNPLSYHWEITNVPPGYFAKPVREPLAYWTSSSNCEFTPNVAGEYRVMLLVKDSMGIISQPVWRTINVNTNTPPVADAGSDKAVILIGDTVHLDGSQSWDPDGNSISFQWSFSSWPGNSDSPPTTAPTLSGADTATPYFVAGVHGTYTLQLVVNDGQADSAPSFVTVSFNNIAPVANAGGNQIKVLGDTVLLDGYGSSDANHDSLTYQWSLVTKPAGSNASLNATTAQASFIVDLPTSDQDLYVVSLTVSDGIASNTQNVAITVLTKQDAATENLASTVDVVNSLPPETLPTFFVNSNQANALTSKINAALKLIDQKQYAAALDKLETDILPKTDGCATQGAPDKNDWIKDCPTQKKVYDSVKDTIELLQGLQ